MGPRVGRRADHDGAGLLEVGVTAAQGKFTGAVGDGVEIQVPIPRGGADDAAEKRPETNHRPIHIPNFERAETGCRPRIGRVSGGLQRNAHDVASRHRENSSEDR